LGRDRRRRCESCCRFFLERAAEIEVAAARVRRDWPIFGWRSPDETERDAEETIIRESLTDPGRFNALEHCGHYSAEDVLPAHAIESFLAFRLADGDFQEWLWTLEHCDALEITMGFAMKRTEMYLATEQRPH
jgi:hypothetical protein